MTHSLRSGQAMAESRLPLPLLRQGKVREVYDVDPEHLLLVASDRVSAFDVVMNEPVPRKGAVLTQVSAFWFERLAPVFPSHYLTARTTEIIQRIPGLDGYESEIAGRAIFPDRRGRSIETTGRWRVSRCQPDWLRAHAWTRPSFPRPPRPKPATILT
jgi:phosphoribosylaminoimidazole-succinocarboxamide synthase